MPLFGWFLDGGTPDLIWCPKMTALILPSHRCWEDIKLFVWMSIHLDHPDYVKLEPFKGMISLQDFQIFMFIQYKINKNANHKVNTWWVLQFLWGQTLQDIVSSSHHNHQSAWQDIGRSYWLKMTRHHFILVEIMGSPSWQDIMDHGSIAGNDPKN